MSQPAVTATTRLVAIGHSRGVRLPKHILEASGLQGELEIDASPGQVILRAAKDPRAGWAEAFARMAEQGDDLLLDQETATEFDRNEWRWGKP